MTAVRKESHGGNRAAHPVEDGEAGSLRLVWDAVSDIGHLRRENQDAYSGHPSLNLFVVADGMGGMRGGAVAARMVVDGLPVLVRAAERRTVKRPASVLRTMLVEALRALNQQIHQAGFTNRMYRGMGATVVAVLVHGHYVHVAHAGDSRVYLLRKDGIALLTEDHSVVAELVRRGEITPEEAQLHPAHNQITRYIGMEFPFPADARSVRVHAGDRLLLCTDGLTGMVGDQEIGRILKAQPTPRAACRCLVERALQQGGFDNITALAIYFPE